MTLGLLRGQDSGSLLCDCSRPQGARPQGTAVPQVDEAPPGSPCEADTPLHTGCAAGPLPTEPAEDFTSANARGDGYEVKEPAHLSPSTPQPRRPWPPPLRVGAAGREQGTGRRAGGGCPARPWETPSGSSWGGPAQRPPSSGSRSCPPACPSAVRPSQGPLLVTLVGGRTCGDTAPRLVTRAEHVSAYWPLGYPLRHVSA